MINSILVFALQNVDVPYRPRQFSMRGRSIWKGNNIMQAFLERKRDEKEFKKAGPAREVYSGDPWTNRRAWG